MALPFNVDCLGISFFWSGEAARPPRLSEFRLAMAGRRWIKSRKRFYKLKIHIRHAGVSLDCNQE